MKVVKNNLMILLAQKAQRDGVARLGLKTVSTDTKVSYYTLRSMANDTIQEYPKNVLATLCAYLSCTPGDLLTLVDAPENS
jgi:DNA-binding Xre family transcriptional regulator